MSSNQTQVLGRVNNPNSVHAILSQGDVNNDDGHGLQNIKEGFFMLRLPFDEGTRFLELMKELPQGANMARSLSGSNASGQTSTKIDLSGFL